MSKKQFVAERTGRYGDTKASAERLYSRLQASGFQDPNTWHAQRAAGLLDKAYVSERKRAGVSKGVASRELSRLKKEGYESPGRWHAKRPDSLFTAKFTKVRKGYGVPDEQIKKEIAKLKRMGRTQPGAREAEKLPTPGGFKAPAGKKVIRSKAEYYRLLEEAEAAKLAYEEWVSSLDY